MNIEIPSGLITLFRYVFVPAFSAAGGMAAVLLIGRRYLVEKIGRSIQHNYDQKLESHRETLRKQTETELRRLERQNAEQMAAQKTAFTAFQDSHHLAFERRLKAIETLWSAMLDVLRNTPSIVALTDIFLIDEYLRRPSDQACSCCGLEYKYPVVARRLCRTPQGIDETCSCLCEGLMN